MKAKAALAGGPADDSTETNSTEESRHDESTQRRRPDRDPGREAISGPAGFLPARMASDPTLTQSHWRVMLAVASFANRERRAFPSYKLIARRCGLSVATVRRRLDELEAFGYVKSWEHQRPGGGFGSKDYLVVFGDSDCSDFNVTVTTRPRDTSATTEREPDQTRVLTAERKRGRPSATSERKREHSIEQKHLNRPPGTTVAAASSRLRRSPADDDLPLSEVRDQANPSTKEEPVAEVELDEKAKVGP